MLDQIKSPDVRVYAVWVPISPTDLSLSVPRATKRLPDERTTHYWDSKGELTRAFSRVLKLKDEQPAWDVYFLFDRDAEWLDQPPESSYWMHQLDLEPGRILDGDKLAAETKKLLEAAKK